MLGFLVGEIVCEKSENSIHQNVRNPNVCLKIKKKVVAYVYHVIFCYCSCKEDFKFVEGETTTEAECQSSDEQWKPKEPTCRGEIITDMMSVKLTLKVLNF